MVNLIGLEYSLDCRMGWYHDKILDGRLGRLKECSNIVVVAEFKLTRQLGSHPSSTDEGKREMESLMRLETL